MLKTLIVSLLLLFVNEVVMAKIYKYIDEDGNTHYSEQQPFADNKVAEQKDVTVIESNTIKANANWKRERHKEKFTAFNFDDFVISDPIAGENIKSKGGNLIVSVNLKGELPALYRIKFFLDDMPHGRVKSNTQLIADVENGNHTLYAQVIESRSRKVIKTTPTINFHFNKAVD